MGFGGWISRPLTSLFMRYHQLLWRRSGGGNVLLGPGMRREAPPLSSEPALNWIKSHKIASQSNSYPWKQKGYLRQRTQVYICSASGGE